MTSMDYFTVVTLVALPAAVAYPVIYGFRTRWWQSWIGQALLIKALGLATLLVFTALVLVLGPDYSGRSYIRNTGITLIAAGVWLALVAMLREFRRR